MVADSYDASHDLGCFFEKRAKEGARFGFRMGRRRIGAYCSDFLIEFVRKENKLEEIRHMVSS